MAGESLNVLYILNGLLTNSLSNGYLISEASVLNLQSSLRCMTFCIFMQFLLVISLGAFTKNMFLSESC